MLFDPQAFDRVGVDLARDDSPFENPSPMYRGMRSTGFRFPDGPSVGCRLENFSGSRFAADHARKFGIGRSARAEREGRLHLACGPRNAAERSRLGSVPLKLC